VTYTVAAVLGVVGAIVIDVAILRTRLIARQVFWLTYPLVLVAQLIANGVLTGAGVVRYSRHAIIGLRIAYAPVEDLFFGFALVLVTLSVWVWLGRRGLDREPLAGDRATDDRVSPPAADDRR
jgi:lycopene cyclase domain-containing protein